MKNRFLSRPSPFFKRPSLSSPNFPKNTMRSRLCGPNTLPPVPFGSVFLMFFAKINWFAALRPCFTVPKPCLAVFCKKSDPLTSVQSKHAFAPLIFHFFRGNVFFYVARAFLLSARALCPRISHTTLSAHACAIETRFRPSTSGVFFGIFH